MAPHCHVCTKCFDKWQCGRKVRHGKCDKCGSDVITVGNWDNAICEAIRLEKQVEQLQSTEPK